MLQEKSNKKAHVFTWADRLWQKIIF